MTTEMTNNQALHRALVSLEGLATGDAFGQRFFAPGNVGLIARREPPPPYWSYTDDTAMAIEIVRVMRRHRHIDQDELAVGFARSFAENPRRGYAAGAIQLLTGIAAGDSWREGSLGLFGGEGSMGNGGAMRVAPVGAYFADDLDKVVQQARLSAEVTHAHPEGQAGAIAVAIGAALAQQSKPGPVDVADLFDRTIEHTPNGLTRTNLKQAAVLPRTTSISDVTRTLGNGSRVVAFDTVPFSLWCAFHHLDSFEDAMWTCVSGGGDIDTNAAIAGGIVACRVGREGIPKRWLKAREDLPSWMGVLT